jgi:hypothetical protein
MEGVSEEPRPLVGAVGEQVPEAVGRAAAEHGLGELVDVRREVVMGRVVLISVGVAVVAGGLLVLISYLAKDLSEFNPLQWLMRFVGLALFFLTFWACLYALRTLVIGSRAHYLFAGGLVNRRRGRPRAVAWPQVEQLKPVYNRRGHGADGTILGYQVRTGGRGLFTVPLRLTDGRDPFMDRIIERLRAHDRPVG